MNNGFTKTADLMADLDDHTDIRRPGLFWWEVALLCGCLALALVVVLGLTVVDECLPTKGRDDW